MISYLRNRPMIISAVGCVLTAVCGFYSEILLSVCIVIWLVLLALSLGYKNKSMAVAIVLIIVMSANCYITLKDIESLEALQGETVTAEIIFTDTVYKSERYFRSEGEIIKSDRLPAGTKIALWHPPADVDSQYIFKAQLKLDEIDGDFKASNFSKSIYLDAGVSSLEKTDRYDPVERGLHRVRNYIKNTLFSSMSFDSASTMVAVVLGDIDYFSNEFYGNVKASGVAHVMVVSGMHLSILVALVLKICEKYIYNPQIRALIMYLTVMLLCAVCGFTMSILRAGVTYLIMGFGILLNRNYSGENALGAAICFISISSPFAIFSIGFQLSVLSTFGILAVALPICDFISNKNKGLPKLVKGAVFTVITSLSATLLTLPVIIYIFGYISVVSVITNLLIDGVVTFALSVAVVCLALSLAFPNISALALRLLDLVVKYINFVINFMGSLGFSVVRVHQHFTYIAVLLVFLTFWILLACKKREDMLKLKKINRKVIKERGSLKKWQLFLKRG